MPIPTDTQDLKTELEHQYQILCFHDLDTVSAKHGTMFKILRSLRQDSFGSNQRLVFYCRRSPDQIQIDHLQRAAARVDISNWFIMICCAQDITPQLALANQRHGYDDQTIAWKPAWLEPSTSAPKIGIYPWQTFCFKPFVSLEVSTDGNIRPCCKFRGSVGNAHKDDLPSVMAGTKLQLLRQQFLQGQRSGSCQICWDQEDTGTTSIRHHSLTKYEEQSEYDDVDSPVVRDLTIAPSNVCNFTCRICNHTNSSAIAAENLAVSTEDSQRQMFRMYLQGSHLVPDDVYQSMINDISPTLHMLHLLGGEPLLHKNLPKWLDLIISSGHADHIDIEINSNGSVWNDRLIELLQKFHSVQILLSIDDIGARFELQRGGSWSEVDRNTRLWAAQQNDTFQVDVTPAVSLQNLLYLDDLVTYVQTLGLGLVWFYVDGPSHWSIDNATSHMRDLAITRYQNHPHAELRAIAERLRTIKGTNGRAFVSAVNALDLRRSQRFADAHAEAWQAMTAAQNPSQTIDHSVTIDL